MLRPPSANTHIPPPVIVLMNGDQLATSQNRVGYAAVNTAELFSSHANITTFFTFFTATR
jgi:hypothetical protein